jgi:hypothetical protein
MNFNLSIKISVIFIIALFLSKEVFSYDFEKVVISSIIFFLVILYHNSYDILYNLFYLKSLKFKEEYLELIEIKKRVEKKVFNFIKFFYKKENYIINIINYIIDNLNNMFKSLKMSRKVLISFLIKIKLNSIINFYLNSNKIQKIVLLNSFLSKVGFILNIVKYKTNLKKFNDKYIASNIIYLLLNLRKSVDFSTNGKN